MIYVKLAGLLTILFLFLFSYSFLVWAYAMSKGPVSRGRGGKMRAFPSLATPQRAGAARKGGSRGYGFH